MKKRLFSTGFFVSVIFFLISAIILPVHANEDANLSVEYNAAAYPDLRGNNAQYEWIDKVQVGSLNNTSGTNGGYWNFTAQNLNATIGENVSLTLTPGFDSGSYREYWKIWIDFNQDSDFADSGEAVFSKSGNNTVSGSFTIPSSALNGKTRIRIAMAYNASPPSSGQGSFDNGEVEDYSITITGEPGPTPDPIIFEDKTVHEAYQLIQQTPGILIVDVRTQSEYNQGHLKNAILIDYYSSTFRKELNKLGKTKAYIVYCKSGNRSKKAHNIMKELGFKETYNMLGGFTDWKAKGYPVSYK